MTDMIAPVDKQYLMTDDDIKQFIVNGYTLVQTQPSPAFHQSICEQIDRVFADEGNPLDAILDRVPDLYEIYESHEVRGVLSSILGPDYQMNSHRHCHLTEPGHPGGHWHQDGVNRRHHRIQVVLAMYYPQDVTEDMGPTIVLPGTQYHNTPTTLMRSYMNFKTQVPLTVKAGTVAITHYDLWHAWMPNTSTVNRRMLKFLFSRQSEPSEPSWNAGPYGDIEARFLNMPIDDQSDLYKHRRIWANVWRWLHGVPAEDRW